MEELVEMMIFKSYEGGREGSGGREGGVRGRVRGRDRGRRGRVWGE